MKCVAAFLQHKNKTLQEERLIFFHRKKIYHYNFYNKSTEFCD